jgi:hypothetical protein
MFITEAMIQQLRRNINRDPAVAAAVQELVSQAARWRETRDEELWNLMFGPTPTRAWHVYANGFCPSCKAPVPMYTWLVDAEKKPWKMTCPHCQENFPKNDFAAFYRSGLDAHGVFDQARADRRLLFNVEHPDPHDPLHLFGVDDGEAYRDGNHRWYFVGAYLVYGVWYQQILPAIDALAGAYVLTGEAVYAHKAAILLDRVADLYPLFDFKQQSVHKGVSNGYVTTWHGACEDTRRLALAYDMIREAIPQDAALVEFLSGQARRYQLDNPKIQGSDIQRNIEERILRDAVRNEHKVGSNYPRSAIAQDIFLRILEPANEAAARTRLETIVERATRVDGITGEKGLASYSAYTINSLAAYLAQLARRDPEFLGKLLVRQPALRQTFRFHIDTWCLQKYYPNIGDGTDLADIVTMWHPERWPVYAGMSVSKTATLEASTFSLLMDLYKATGDTAYLQVIYHANNRSTQNLPYDLFSDNAAAFKQEVERVIAKAGPVIELKSVNKEQWCVGILRSGKGDAERALWLDYDVGGGAHAHGDGLNLGLFAYGLDLLPDFGYPQIQYSGPESNKARWFADTAAHNTVVVDGVDQGKTLARGKTLLWADGTDFHAIRAGFDAQPLPVTGVYGRAYGSVALYSYYGGRFSAVRVWTRASNAEEWTLQFTDDFKRGELGPDWHVKDGEWRIENGEVVGKGTLLCTRNFPGQQRLEYSAITDVAEPCDLSAYLSWNGEASGCFFGFGSMRNVGSRIIVREVVAAHGEARIIRGKRHQVTCFCEDGRAQLIVDGAVAVDCTSLPNPSFRFIFGEAQGKKQFERTVGLVDLSPKDFYAVDIFRVVGGRDHARFFHSYFGTMTTEGLALTPGGEYGKDTLLQNFRTDPHAKPGWQADWQVEDKLKLLPAGANIHLRHTDLTTDAAASVTESWVNIGNFNSKNETWIPTILTRRQSDAPLASTFVAVIEPYEGNSKIKATRRLTLQTPAGIAYHDNYVAIEVELIDGRRDLIIAADIADPLNRTPSLAQDKMMIQPDWGVRTDAELVIVRRDAQGRIIHIAMCRGRVLEAGELSTESETLVEYAERGGTQ